MTKGDEKKTGLTVFRIPVLILLALLAMLAIGILLFSRA